MSTSNSRAVALAISVGLVLGGCISSEHEDLKTWMAEQAKDMKGRVPPLPEIKPFPVVAYEGESQRSPFSPDKSVAGEGLKDPSAPDSSRARQPLENFPLDSLRVTGVIFVGKKHIAMISTPPPNKPKQVGVGEFIGQNFGKVVSIDGEGVHLIELYKDQNGAWTERPFTLSVAREGNRK
jgi:type IV pilus assembly protein PilP